VAVADEMESGEWRERAEEPRVETRPSSATILRFAVSESRAMLGRYRTWRTRIADWSWMSIG
jgi:hypothetical protein